MMGRAVGRCFRTVLALLLATGCAKDGGGSDAKGEDGGAAGAAMAEPMPTSPCLAGGACKCGNGEVGETLCRDDVASCKCADCAPFVPASPAAFGACGGAPEGTWLTRSYDISGVVAHFGKSVLDATKSVTCRAALSELAAPSLRLVLNVDGSAEVTYVAPEVYGTVLESCIQAGLEQSCEQIPSCDDTGCGTCGCNLEGADFSGTAEKWSKQAATLSVGPLTFNYCVDGETMSVVNADNGTRFELERVVAHEQKCVGVPAKCGINESEKNCKLVRGCSATSACTGDAVRTCDYLVDVCTACPAGCTCEAKVGQSQCAGTAYCQDMTTMADCLGLDCAWQNFVGCGGDPEPCDTLTVEQCRFTPGCKVE